MTKGRLATVNKSSLCKREGRPQSIHRSKSVGGRAGEGPGLPGLASRRTEGGRWAARGSSRAEGRLCLFLRMRVNYEFEMFGEKNPLQRKRLKLQDDTGH